MKKSLVYFFWMLSLSMIFGITIVIFLPIVHIFIYCLLVFICGILGGFFVESIMNVYDKGEEFSENQNGGQYLENNCDLEETIKEIRLGILDHEVKRLTKEEVENGRSSAYKYII